MGAPVRLREGRDPKPGADRPVAAIGADDLFDFAGTLVRRYRREGEGALYERIDRELARRVGIDLA